MTSNFFLKNKSKIGELNFSSFLFAKHFKSQANKYRKFFASYVFRAQSFSQKQPKSECVFCVKLKKNLLKILYSKRHLNSVRDLHRLKFSKRKLFAVHQKLQIFEIFMCEIGTLIHMATLQNQLICEISVSQPVGFLT